MFSKFLALFGPKVLAEHIFYTHINLWTTIKFGFHHEKNLEKKLNLIYTECPIIDNEVLGSLAEVSCSWHVW